MTFLPIVERELRVAARRPSTYWIRFFAAVSVLLIWLALVSGTARVGQAALSHNLFIALGVLALGYSLLAGIFLTADCLSEEKREGTLGLLFLTDLRGYDVVLGKLIGTSIRSAFGLFAIFPILGLPLLMGGVTGGEVWRVVLTLLATLFSSLSLGMFVSAFNREARQAMAATFLGILMLSGILPAFWWLGFILRGVRPGTSLLLFSPVQLFRSAFDFCYRTRNGPQEFWASLNAVFWFSLSLLIAAAVLLPRTWQEGKLPAQDQNWGDRFRRFAPLAPAGWLGNAGERLLRGFSPRAFSAATLGLLLGLLVAMLIDRSGQFEGVENSTRWLRLGLFLSFGFIGILLAMRYNKDHPSLRSERQSLESNPFFWLAARDQFTWVIACLLLCGLSVLWACFLIAAVAGSKSHEAFTACFYSAYAMHQVFKYVVAVEATREVSEGRRSGGLELLLVSPLEESKIIQGQAQALEQHFAGLKRLLVVINLCMCGATFLFQQTLSMSGEDQAAFAELFLGGILLLYLDFKALGTVGMLAALRCKRHHRAVLTTLGRVMGIPWAIIFLFVFLAMSGALNGTKPGPVFAVWFALSIVNNLLVRAGARASLAQGLRQYLLENNMPADQPVEKIPASTLAPVRA